VGKKRRHGGRVKLAVVLNGGDEVLLDNSVTGEQRSKTESRNERGGVGRCLQCLFIG
jgi:hypothetical protein